MEPQGLQITSSTSQAWSTGLARTPKLRPPGYEGAENDGRGTKHNYGSVVNSLFIDEL